MAGVNEAQTEAFLQPYPSCVPRLALLCFRLGTLFCGLFFSGVTKGSDASLSGLQLRVHQSSAVEGSKQARRGAWTDRPRLELCLLSCPR